MTCTHLVRCRDGFVIGALDPKIIGGYVCGIWGGRYCRICKKSDLVSITP